MIHCDVTYIEQRTTIIYTGVLWCYLLSISWQYNHVQLNVSQR